MALIIVAAVILLAGVGVALYLLAFDRPPATQAGPAATVTSYFEALSSGDTSAVPAMFTTENRPSEMELRIVAAMFGNGALKIKEVKTGVVSQTTTDAEVEVTDMTMSMAGRDIKMSEMGARSAFKCKLKKVGGKWLIDQGGTMPLAPTPGQMQNPTTNPTVPSTGI